jgi:hypothetical protein
VQGRLDYENDDPGGQRFINNLDVAFAQNIPGNNSYNLGDDPYYLPRPSPDRHPHRALEAFWANDDGRH